jgi:hypothetical protein
MVTVLDPTRTQESHLIISGISWEQFEAIEAAFADVAGVRFMALLD